MQTANIFNHLPSALSVEVTDCLLQSGALKIERIVSQGQHSPIDFWYEQEQNEWVILLQGAATLRFEAGDRRIDLLPGDYVHIPALERHRVESTTPDQASVWLAVFY